MNFTKSMRVGEFIVTTTYGSDVVELVIAKVVTDYIIKTKRIYVERDLFFSEEFGSRLGDLKFIRDHLFILKAETKITGCKTIIRLELEEPDDLASTRQCVANMYPEAYGAWDDLRLSILNAADKMKEQNMRFNFDLSRWSERASKNMADAFNKNGGDSL